VVTICDSKEVVEANESNNLISGSCGGSEAL
jgi:hypothetical protein